MKVKFNLDFISKFMSENNMDKVAFCKFCNISSRIYDKIFTQNLKFDVYEFYKIAVSMNVKTQDLLIYEK